MTLSPACPFCRAHTLRLVREPIEIAFGQRQATVVAERLRCSTCDQTSINAEQLDLAQRVAADRIRTDEGLLTGAEIRRIRESLSLTQHDFERLLGVGPKTVVRWERGTVFQNRATDLLIRLVDSSTDALSLLATWNDVDRVHQGRPAGETTLVASTRTNSTTEKMMAANTEASSPLRPVPTSNLDERYAVVAAGDASRTRRSGLGRRQGDPRVLPIGPHLAKHTDAFETRVSLDEAAPSTETAAGQILDAYSL